MLRLGAPVRRSYPFRALARSPPLEVPPNALKSSEQAHRVLEASSANTPVIDREPDAPGATNSAVAPVRGLARTMPPSPSRPMNRVPSRVEVMLSGNALPPESAIHNGPAPAVVIQKGVETNAPKNAAFVRHGTNEGEILIINVSRLHSHISCIEIYDSVDMGFFGIAVAAILRFRFGDSTRPATHQP